MPGTFRAHHKSSRARWRQENRPVVARYAGRLWPPRCSWVVERTFAWLNQFRRLHVRYDRRADIHAGVPLPRKRPDLLAVAAKDVDDGASGCSTCLLTGTAPRPRRSVSSGHLKKEHVGEHQRDHVTEDRTTLRFDRPGSAIVLAPDPTMAATVPAIRTPATDVNNPSATMPKRSPSRSQLACRRCARLVSCEQLGFLRGKFILGENASFHQLGQTLQLRGDIC
jgi:hypothetical protein